MWLWFCFQNRRSSSKTFYGRNGFFFSCRVSTAKTGASNLILQWLTRSQLGDDEIENPSQLANSSSSSSSLTIDERRESWTHSGHSNSKRRPGKRQQGKISRESTLFLSFFFFSAHEEEEKEKEKMQGLLPGIATATSSSTSINVQWHLPPYIVSRGKGERWNAWRVLWFSYVKTLSLNNRVKIILRTLFWFIFHGSFCFQGLIGRVLWTYVARDRIHGLHNRKRSRLTEGDCVIIVVIVEEEEEEKVVEKIQTLVTWKSGCRAIFLSSLILSISQLFCAAAAAMPILSSEFTGNNTGRKRASCW